MRYNRAIFSILVNMTVCGGFSFESPHRGDSNEYNNIPFANIIMKIALIYSKSAAMCLFPRDSRTSSK